MLQTSFTSDSSEKDSPKKLPFCMSHGLPDDRLHELFDYSFPSEDDYIDIFEEGNFCNNLFYCYSECSIFSVWLLTIYMTYSVLP